MRRTSPHSHANICYILIGVKHKKIPESFFTLEARTARQEGVSGGGMPSRPSVAVPPPDSLEASPGKILFSFLEKFSGGARKRKKCKEYFAWARERQRAAAGRERAPSFQITTRAAARESAHIFDEISSSLVVKLYIKNKKRAGMGAFFAKQ